METRLMDKFKWRMAKWLWAPPGDMPVSDPEYTEWMKPSGKPVKNKQWHLYRVSRGAKTATSKPIEEFYHRGSYEHHESHERHTPKAVMAFRGKGSKVERRQKKRKK